MALKTAARSAAQLSPQWKQFENSNVSSDNNLAHYCKWRAASENSLREAEFSEFEDEINFAISLAILLLTIGIASFAGIHFGKPPRWLFSTCIFALGCYMLWRFLYLKRTEERAWYTAFLLMPPEAQADSSESEQHGDPGTSDE